MIILGTKVNGNYLLLNTSLKSQKKPLTLCYCHCSVCYNSGFHAALLFSLTLILGGVFFCQESFVLQHASAIFEWVFCVIVALFYGTFAFEFAGMSGDTMALLARGGALRPAGREHNVDPLGGPGPHSQPHPHPPEYVTRL